MQLDFTAIRGDPVEKKTETATDAPESPTAAFNGIALTKLLEPTKKPSGGKIEPNLEGEKAGRLAIQYRQEQAERDRTREVYREYQQNIKSSGGLRTEILKGAKAGEPPVGLLLKAVKCISLMTSDTVFYNQLEGDIKSIYGAGLLEPEPLEIELKETQERLQRLEQALKRDTEPADSKKRIERAIQAHRERISQLQGLIEQGKTQL